VTAFDAPERLPRFERDLREALREEAGLQRPDYLSDVLLRTVDARQRPAWTFPERWLPMSATTSRAATAPRIPWRILAVAAIIAILALAAALVAGSRRHVPAPFGLAANGLVAYAKSGDIYAADPVTGEARAIITGSAQDSEPFFSRDGTMLAFLRQVGNGNGQLMIAAADGSGMRPITQVLPGLGTYDIPDSRNVLTAFSPDGGEVAFTLGNTDSKTLWVADVRQGVARQLQLGLNIDPYTQPVWLSLAGDEVLFEGQVGSDTVQDFYGGLYAVDVHSGKVRPIVTPTPGFGVGNAVVSPDGTRIAYSRTNSQITDRNSYEVHIVNSDGSGDVTLPMPASAVFQDRPIWSNDGTRLAIVRGYDAHNQDTRVAIVPADGSNTGVETKPRITGCCDTVMDWSPDDTSILVLPEDLNGNMTSQLLVDPSTGSSMAASWGGISLPAWERRAP
jgi:Tol biopolymer transport system component